MTDSCSNSSLKSCKSNLLTPSSATLPPISWNSPKSRKPASTTSPSSSTTPSNPLLTVEPRPYPTSSRICQLCSNRHANPTTSQPCTRRCSRSTLATSPPSTWTRRSSSGWCTCRTTWPCSSSSGRTWSNYRARRTTRCIKIYGKWCLNSPLKSRTSRHSTQNQMDGRSSSTPSSSSSRKRDSD